MYNVPSKEYLSPKTEGDHTWSAKKCRAPGRKFSLKVTLSCDNTEMN